MLGVELKIETWIKRAFHWCAMSVSEDSIKVDVILYFTHWLLDSFEIGISCCGLRVI